MADEIQVNLTSTTVQAGGVYSGDTVIGAASMVDSKRLVSALAVGAVQESAILDAISGGYVLTIGGTLTANRTVTFPDAAMTVAGQNYANVFTVGQQFPVGSSSALGIVLGALANASNRTGLYGDLTASAEKIAMVVGGVAGPVWTRSGSAVNLAGLGSLSTTSSITANINAAALATSTNAPGTNRGFLTQGPDGGGSGFILADFGNGSTLQNGMLVYQAQGTGALPAATANNDGAVFALRGHDGTNFTQTQAQFIFTSTGTWTPTSCPTQAQIQVTASGSTAMTTALTATATRVTTIALTASSVTNSSLTSGRVPFAGTGGLMQDSAGMTYSSNVLTVGDQTSAAILRLDGQSGNARQIAFKTAGVNRWLLIGANASAETGSNAGSPFTLQALDDSGASIDNPISINRASGSAIVFSRPLQPGSGSASAPSYAFSTDTTTGFFRNGSGIIGVASAGTLRQTMGSQNVINNNAVALGTSPITSVQAFNLHGADSAQVTYAVHSYGGTGGFYSRHAEGTAASPTACVSGSVLLGLFTQGYEGTTPGFTTAKLPFQIIATETWTSTAQGFRQDWFTAASGTTSATFKMRLDQDGNLLVGTSTNGMTAGGSLAIAQDFAHRGNKYGIFNATPIVQKTGYGTPTGNAYQASFAAGSITLPNLAAAVAQLILDLKAYGLIGA